MKFETGVLLKRKGLYFLKTEKKVKLEDGREKLKKMFWQRWNRATLHFLACETAKEAYLQLISMYDKESVVFTL